MTTNDTLLLDLLQAVADEVEQLANALDDTMWERFIETEQRTVGQLLDHIAWAWVAESAAFRALARGTGSSGFTQEWLDTENANQAEISRTATGQRSRSGCTMPARWQRGSSPGWVPSSSNAGARTCRASRSAAWGNGSRFAWSGIRASICCRSKQQRVCCRIRTMAAEGQEMTGLPKPGSGKTIEIAS